MATFDLQFDPSRIPDLAASYSYADDAGARAAGAAAAARGHYRRDEFIEVCRWKAKRAERKFEVNTADEIERATGRALSAPDEADRMEALLELMGVGVPIASALLHFAYPDRYPILDVRALEALGIKARSVYPVSLWLDYLDACRDLARRHAGDIRMLDKALWQWSKARDT